jgi:hypothetical protein
MNFMIEASAQKSAHRHGLSLDRLKNMAAHAAVVTHARGNRRFHDWVMKIDGVWILDVAPFAALPGAEMARLRGLSKDAIALSRSS